MITTTLIADTVHETERITTVECTVPKLLLAQINKHRIISNNAESSRAVPFNLVLKQIMDNPYVPQMWGKKGKGMSPNEYHTDQYVIQRLRRTWLEARDLALTQAKLLDEDGVHKELTNRLVEPYRYVNVVLTATTWSNFITLRSAPGAQYEMQQLAEQISNVLKHNVPKVSLYHLPYTDETDGTVHLRKKLSVARCAAISYNRTAIKDKEADLVRYAALAADGHWSAFEHTAVAAKGQHKNLTDWRSVRCNMINEHDATLLGAHND